MTLTKSWSETQPDYRWRVRYIGRPCYATGCPVPPTHLVEYGNGEEDRDPACEQHLASHPANPLVKVFSLPARPSEAGVAECCYIPEERQAEARRCREVAATDGESRPPLNCPRVAEWNIHSRRDPPDAVTQACTAHVGELLSDPDYHSVWPV